MRIEELEKTACMEALDELFDDEKKKIELIDDFKQADANGDDIVTKKEAIDAFWLYKPLTHSLIDQYFPQGRSEGK